MASSSSPFPHWMFSRLPSQKRGMYRCLLFSRFGAINENSQDLCLFPGSSFWGWWVQSYEPSTPHHPAPLCNPRFLSLHRQYLYFMTRRCAHFLVCVLTGDFFDFCFKLFLLKFWKSDILNRSLYHFNWEIPSDILKDCVICHWVQLHCIPLFLCGRFFMVIQISHDFLDFASQNCKMGCWD